MISHQDDLKDQLTRYYYNQEKAANSVEKINLRSGSKYKTR